MLTYVSFDPGNSTGVAEWDEKGEPNEGFIPTEFNQEQLDYYLLKLEESSAFPEIFIIEEYILWKERNKQGSKIETIQVIGQLKAFARKHNIGIVEQKAGCKDIAAVWAGMPSKTKHMPNWQSAYLHGYHYLFKVKKLIRPRVLDG